MTVDIKELKKRLKDASGKVGSGWKKVSRGGIECSITYDNIKNDRNEDAAAEIKVCFDEMIQADLTEDEIGKVLPKSLMIELLKTWAPESWNGLANLLAGKDRLRSILSHEAEKVLRDYEKRSYNEPFLLGASGFENARLVAENTWENKQLVFGDKGLDTDVARGLSYFGGTLELTVGENNLALGPGSLSSDSIEALANHEGILILRLGEINVETATALSMHKGPVEISCADWSDESLIALSKLENDLIINYLPEGKWTDSAYPEYIGGELSSKCAESLSKHQGELSLWGVTNLSDEAAMCLSKRTAVLNFYGQTPTYDSTLDGHLALLESQVKNNLYNFSIRLANLEPQIARILSQHGKGEENYTDLRIDVESIDEECAQILSGHEGTLYLEELVEISDEAAKALAQHTAGNIHWADEDSKSYPFISFSTYEMASRVKEFRLSLKQKDQEALMKASAPQQNADEIDLWSFLLTEEQIIVVATCDVDDRRKLVWLDQDTLEAKEEIIVPLKLRSPILGWSTKWTKEDWLDNGKLIANEWRKLLSFAKGSCFQRFGPGIGWGGQAGKMVGDHLLFCTRLYNRVLVDSKLHLMSENEGSIISKTIAGGCSGIWEHNGVIGLYLRKCLDKTSFNKGFRKIIKSVENTIQFYDAKTLKPKQKIQLGITVATDDDMLRYTQACGNNSIIKKYDSLQWGWAVFASDKNQIVISQGSNRMLEVLDGGTGEKLRASKSYDTCITMIAVSPDESVIAVAVLDQIIILDFETLKVKSSIPFSGDFSQSTSQEEVVYMEYISDDSLLIFGRSEEEINYKTVIKKRVILCKDPASGNPSFSFAGQKSVRIS